MSTAGCGRPRLVALDRSFVRVALLHDGVEVASHLRELDPARARSIGDAARARVLRAHTYRQRAQQLDGLLRELPCR